MLTDIWNTILEILAKTLNPGVYAVWIKPLAGEVEGDTLTLYAPNEFAASWIRERLLPSIEEAGLQATGLSLKVRIEVRRPDPADNPVETAPEPSPSAQAALPIVQVPVAGQGFKWRHAFNDFVIGPCNELACAASKGICLGSLPSDSLFLSAGAGLGKTHLLHAIGKRLSRTANRSPRIACLTAEEFATRFVLAMRAKELTRFKSEFRDAVDVLLLEDVHFFQGKEKMQDELLGTLTALRERGCKVVLTSSFLPKELSNLDSKLMSRLCAGFMAVIERPDFETRRKIVTRKAWSMGAEIPEQISDLLAERITSDIRQLESCLSNLVLKARLLNQIMSMELALQVLDNYSQAKSRPSFANIIDFVCKTYGLTRDQLRSKSRKQQVVLARNTAFYLARKHTELSLSAIGEVLGRKHSTVLKGITNVEREISGQTPLGRQLENMVQRLEA